MCSYCTIFELTVLVVAVIIVRDPVEKSLGPVTEMWHRFDNIDVSMNPEEGYLIAWSVN